MFCERIRWSSNGFRCSRKGFRTYSNLLSKIRNCPPEMGVDLDAAPSCFWIGTLISGRCFGTRRCLVSGGGERRREEPRTDDATTGRTERAFLSCIYRRGRRLCAGASPWRSIPSGGPETSRACSSWGATSTRVAARASCAATASIPDHRSSQALAVERWRRRGAARLLASARSRTNWQHVALQRPPTSHARTTNLHRVESTSSG